MSITCISSKLESVKADAVVVFVYQDAKAFGSKSKDLIAKFPMLEPIFGASDFTAKKLQCVLGYSETSTPRVILVGLGTSAEVGVEEVRRAASAATKRAASAKCAHIAFEIPDVRRLGASKVAKAVAEGAILSQYSYSKYKTEGDHHQVTEFTFVAAADKLKDVKHGATEASIIAEGVIEARNLANAPNCEIYPTTLGNRAVELGKKFGFAVNVLTKKQIESLKMGGLLGVNLGSVRPPAFIIMEYFGGKKSEQPVVLVGKGVTFDTGGISIKPAAGMSEMKSDMHGAASVIGTMVAIAGLKLKRNVVGIVPATENMPSGTAMVPGDILTFMNGKTAEIDNTDAEGRLILADALCYADRYKPEAVIDLATLTGAVVVALGNTTTGMMGTDAATKNKIKKAADATSEYVCELPLYEEYEELIASDVADVKNSGGRAAGSITAALFLKKFVSFPWVHLDIAGTGIAPKAGHYTPKGATGVGVRMLTEMLQNW